MAWSTSDQSEVGSSSRRRRDEMSSDWLVVDPLHMRTKTKSRLSCLLEVVVEDSEAGVLHDDV